MIILHFLFHNLVNILFLVLLSSNVFANVDVNSQPVEEKLPSKQNNNSLQDQIKDINEYLDEIEESLEGLREKVSYVTPGERKVLFSGNFRSGFSSTRLVGNIPENTTNIPRLVDQYEHIPSTYDIIFRLHPYWKIGERIMAKVDTQFFYTNNISRTFLFFAEFHYIINDYMTSKVGMFLTPFGFWQEQVHVEWMNSLTDEPLPVRDDLIVPTRSLGIQLRGVIPLGKTARLKYATWISNGPQLNTTETVSGPDHHGEFITRGKGSLLFGYADDNNDNKAIGARLALALHPEIQVGASTLYARVGGDDDEHYKDFYTLIYGTDIESYIYAGPYRFTFRGEAIFSTVGKSTGLFGALENATYLTELKTPDLQHPDTYLTELVEGKSISNKRWGVYAQLAIRAFNVKNFLKDFSFLIRADMLDMPDNFEYLSDQKRITLGVLYWLYSTIVLKFDIQRNWHNPTLYNGRNEKSFVADRLGVQLSAGF